MKQQVHTHLKTPDTHVWLEPSKGRAVQSPRGCVSLFPPCGLLYRIHKLGLYSDQLDPGQISPFGENKAVGMAHFRISLLNRRGQRGILAWQVNTSQAMGSGDPPGRTSPTTSTQGITPVPCRRGGVGARCAPRGAHFRKAPPPWQ